MSARRTPENAVEHLKRAATAAERQAARKARQLAAGRVQWKRWVHPDDVPALVEFADKLAKKRERAAKRNTRGPLER